MSTPANDSTIIDAATITSQNIPALECMDKALADLDAFIKNFKELQEKVKTNVKELTAMRTAFQRSRRDVEKGLKKKSKSSKRISDPSRPTGFKKPIRISTELATFLKVDPAELMSRTAVTKSINSYIKEHNLQNPAAKREFDLTKSSQGKALAALLKPTGDVPISYFNLQKWLAPHFPKDDAAVATAPAPAAPAADSKTTPVSTPARRKPSVKAK